MAEGAASSGICLRTRNWLRSTAVTQRLPRAAAKQLPGKPVAFFLAQLRAAADESNRARREIRGRVTTLILLRCPKPRRESHMLSWNGFRSCLRDRKPHLVPNRRDGRVVEGARLESVFRGNSNVGSNPTLSASKFLILNSLQGFWPNSLRDLPDGVLRLFTLPQRLKSMRADHLHRPARWPRRASRLIRPPPPNRLAMHCGKLGIPRGTRKMN